MPSNSNQVTSTEKPSIISKEMLFPFILVALLLPLWGFANDVTNPYILSMDYPDTATRRLNLAQSF